MPFRAREMDDRVVIARCPQCREELPEDVPRSCRRCRWNPLQLLIYLERSLGYMRVLPEQPPFGEDVSDADLIWAIYNQGVGAAAVLTELGLIDRSTEDSWLYDLANAACLAIEKTERARNATGESDALKDAAANVTSIRSRTTSRVDG